MDTELTEWKLEDYVKTPEDRAMFLEASLEEAVAENDPGIFSDALVEVVRSIGKGKAGKGVASVLRAVSAGLATAQTASTISPRAARRRTAPRRDLAHA